MGHLHTVVCAGLIAVAPVTANAQSAPQTVQFLPDADSAAGQWVRANPDGIAVAIRLGKATPVPPERIESVLRSDFQRHGITQLRFFYERGGAGGSSVVFNTRNHAWGPFGLADSRSHVQEAAKQHLFEVRRGLN